VAAHRDADGPFDEDALLVVVDQLMAGAARRPGVSADRQMRPDRACLGAEAARHAGYGTDHMMRRMVLVGRAGVVTPDGHTRPGQSVEPLSACQALEVLPCPRHRVGIDPGPGPMSGRSDDRGYQCHVPSNGPRVIGYSSWSSPTVQRSRRRFWRCATRCSPSSRRPSPTDPRLGRAGLVRTGPARLASPDAHAARVWGMTTKKISAAAAAKRDDARETDGQFGVQPHAEAGEVTVAQLPDFLDGDGWAEEAPNENWRGFTRTTSEGIEKARLFFNGIQTWELNGQPHDVGGPALAHPTSPIAEYYQHGLKHRGDGPAIVHGNRYEKFFLYGVHVQEAALCKVTPDQVVEQIMASRVFGNVAGFTGWTTKKDAQFKAQGQIVNDTIRHLDTYRDAAPVITFPSGAEYTPTVGFTVRGCLVSQYVNFEHLSTDHDAKGIDQARAIAAGILNARDKVASDFYAG
jgi:hypothetical protein